MGIHRIVLIESSLTNLTQGVSIICDSANATNELPPNLFHLNDYYKGKWVLRVSSIWVETHESPKKGVAEGQLRKMNEEKCYLQDDVTKHEKVYGIHKYAVVLLLWPGNGQQMARRRILF